MTGLNADARVLILDDDPSVGSTIAMVAELAGFQTRLTQRPGEFFAALDQWSPTHVILDLVMPELDGVEVLRQLADRKCRARIIVTSGVGDRVLDAARRAGAERGLDICGMLPKPFPPATLRALLTSERPPVASAHEPAQRAAFEVTEAELRSALLRRDFRVGYEPKIDTRSGRVAGFEALVRWHHPQVGIVMPDRFIWMAESSGLISQLTDQVLEMALAWLAGPLANPAWGLSVNLSARSLGDIGLADDIFARCRHHGIDPHRLILEVTESYAMEDPTATLDLLTRLRMKGFELSIDDFGTGYSSMLQLVRLPFSEMKVDRSFVMSALRSVESRAVVKSIIDLGHSLGLRVTGEGVEDAPTLAYLRDLGCDQAQGYFFSRALPGDAVAGWVASRQATAGSSQLEANSAKRVQEGS